MPELLDLKNMRIAITSSTKGIGLGTAKVLTSLGAHVSICGRNPRTLKEALNTLHPRAVGIKCDFSQPGSATKFIEYTVKKLGGLDALVYIPPPPPSGRFTDLTIDDWRLSYRLLIEAAIEAVNASLKHLKNSDNPSITFVTSIAAWEPLSGIATSSVLRPGLHSMTTLLARELGRQGIRVNAVVPGYIMTERLVEVAANRASSSGRTVNGELELLAEEVPLERIGKPEEIGYTIAFLASKAASYVNGALVAVTGGLHKSTR